MEFELFGLIKDNSTVFSSLIVPLVHVIVLFKVIEVEYPVYFWTFVFAGKPCKVSAKTIDSSLIPIFGYSSIIKLDPYLILANWKNLYPVFVKIPTYSFAIIWIRPDSFCNSKVCFSLRVSPSPLNANFAETNSHKLFVANIWVPEWSVKSVNPTPRN